MSYSLDIVKWFDEDLEGPAAPAAFVPFTRRRPSFEAPSIPVQRAVMIAALIVAAPAAPVAFRSAASTTNASGTSNVINKPAGVASGDLLILRVGWTTGTVSSVPAGFVEFTSGLGTYTGWQQRCYWKIAGGSEPSTYTVNFSGTVYSDCDISAYTGADQTTPLGVGDAENTANAGNATPTATGLSITASRDSSLLVHLAVTSAVRTSGPAGMTNQLTYDTSIYVDTVSVGAGATGNKTSTFATVGSWVVHMAVIRPALGAAADPVLRPPPQQQMVQTLWTAPVLPVQRLSAVAAVLPGAQVPRQAQQQMFPMALWAVPEAPAQRRPAVAAILATVAPADTVLTGTRAQARAEALWPEPEAPQQLRKMIAAVRPAVVNTFAFSATADGRGLLKNGEPFTAIGCALWAGCVHRTDAEWEDILDGLEAVRMNMVQIEIWSFNSAVSYGPANVDGDLPWTKNVSGGTYVGTRATADMQFPNDVYWTKVRTRLQQIEDRGMMIFACVSPFGFYGANTGILDDIVLSSNDVAAHEQFADYLVNGNGSFAGLKSLANLTIFVGSDAGTNNATYVSNEYATASTRQLAFMQRLKAQGLKCLMAYNGQSPTSASDEDPFNDEVSFNPCYTYGLVFPSASVSESGLRTYEQARHTYQFTPTLSTQSRDGASVPSALPAFLFETAYFGSAFVPGASYDLRKAMNWAVLSGCTAGFIWGHEILYILSGSNATLVSYLATDTANDVRRFAELTDNLPVELSTLVPSELSGMPQIVAGSRGSQSGLPTNYIASAADPGGKCLLAYVPRIGVGTQTFDVDLTVMSANCRLRWYDPTDGTFRSIALGADHTDTSYTVVTPGTNHEGENDWFLLADIPDTYAAPVGNRARQLSVRPLWEPLALPIQRGSLVAAILSAPQVETPVLRTQSRQLGALALWVTPTAQQQRPADVASTLLWDVPPVKPTAQSAIGQLWAPPPQLVQRAPAVAAIFDSIQRDTVLRTALPVATWPADRAPVQRIPGVAAIAAPQEIALRAPTSGYPRTWPADPAPVQRVPSVAAIVPQADAMVPRAPSSAQRWPADPAPVQRLPSVAAITAVVQVADQFPHAPIRSPSTWPADPAPVQRVPAVAAILAPAPAAPGTVLDPCVTQQGVIQTLWLPPSPPVQRAKAVAAITVPPSQTITGTGIASLEAFGTAQVNLNIAVSDVASAEAFGTTVVAPGPVTVSPGGIASLEAFGSATITVGSAAVSPSGIASLEAFGSPIVAGPITVVGIASLETFGHPHAGAGILPATAAQPKPLRPPIVAEIARLPVGTFRELGSAHALSNNLWVMTKIVTRQPAVLSWSYTEKDLDMRLRARNALGSINLVYRLIDGKPVLQSG